MIQASRRGFLFGLGVALAAPMVVKAEILMPVKRIHTGVILDETMWYPKPVLFYGYKAPPPPTASPGDMYYNNISERMYCYNGTKWLEVRENYHDRD